LNTLFASKAFSWTAVMMDLEHVLPTGVQVTSIDPVIAKDAAVTIRLRVTGDRDRTIQLVRNLEVSKRFVSPRLSGEQALSLDKAKAIGAMGGVRPGTTQVSEELGGSGVEFEIFSGYDPLETGNRPQGAGHSKVAAKTKDDSVAAIGKASGKGAGKGKANPPARGAR
jgi:type IV pilus assembly protein PilN